MEEICPYHIGFTKISQTTMPGFTLATAVSAMKDKVFMVIQERAQQAGGMVLIVHMSKQNERQKVLANHIKIALFLIHTE
jgi:hypothetical protein